MAQTSTAINGCNARIRVEKGLASGVMTDISGSSNSYNLGYKRDIGEAFTFEGAFRIRKDCKKDTSLELQFLYTTGDDEARDILETWDDAGGRRRIQIFPNGETNGERVYDGYWLLSEISFSQAASDAAPTPVTATLVSDGQISRNDYTS